MSNPTQFEVTFPAAVLPTSITLYPGVAPHASRHAVGGADPLTPAAIGAATAAQGVKADGAIRYDEEQTLTDEQRAAARDNIAALVAPLILSPPPLSDAPATPNYLEVDFVGGNNGLRFEQVGVTVPRVGFVYAEFGSESVDVAGADITVNVNSGSTSLSVVYLVEGSVPASELVSASIGEGSGDGTWTLSQNHNNPPNLPLTELSGAAEAVVGTTPEALGQTAIVTEGEVITHYVATSLSPIRWELVVGPEGAEITTAKQRERFRRALGLEQLNAEVPVRMSVDSIYNRAQLLLGGDGTGDPFLGMQTEPGSTHGFGPYGATGYNFLNDSFSVGAGFCYIGSGFFASDLIRAEQDLSSSWNEVMRVDLCGSFFGPPALRVEKHVFVGNAVTCTGLFNVDGYIYTGGFICETIGGGSFTVSAAAYNVISVNDSGQLGFFNVVGTTQPAPIADATDAASAITQLNAALAALRSLGLIAT